MSKVQSNKNKKKTPFYFGGVASAMSACCTHPLDLLKVRLQTASSTSQISKHRPSLFRTVADIVKNESIFGLFRGLSASVVRQLTYSTVRFGGYEEIKRFLTTGTFGSEFTFTKTLISGVLAGGLGGVAGTPADVVNVRMQNDGKLPVNERRNYKNIFDGLFKIIRNEGVSSLFKGVVPNVYRAMIMNVSQVGSYDQAKIFLLNNFPSSFKDDVKTHFTCSVFASFVATTASSPVDVIKTRIMNSSKSASNPQYTGFMHAVVTIFKEEGLLAFFKGWVPSFTRLGPQTILTFIFLERMKKIFLNYTHR